MVAPGGRQHTLIAPDPSYLLGLVRGALESLLVDCERLGVTFGLENGYVDRRTPDESNRVSLQRLQAPGWTT